jgi:MerR family transcriptional regulator, light-induced transcriptional regulator
MFVNTPPSGYSGQAMYNIKEAAARSGVSIATLRAWERRYGVVEPQRTPSGYRLYDDGAIRRLRQMRRLLDDGWRPREAAAEVAAGRGPGTEPDLPTEPVPARHMAGAEALIDEFVAAVTPFDLARAHSVLDETFSRAAFEPAMERVVFPALREVGRRWASGELDVAAEHAASHTVLRRLSMLFDAAARSPERPEVVVGLPPRARHDLGALAFAVAVRRRGLDVLYLGADVPVESWLTALRDTGAPLAVIAIPTADDVPAARDVLAALRAGVPQTEVFVGAPGAAGFEVEDETAVLPADIASAARLLAGRLGGRANRVRGTDLEDYSSASD